MRQLAHDTTKLPRKILEELGASANDHDRTRKRTHGPGNRKEQRKAARVEKKTKHRPIAFPIERRRQNDDKGELLKIRAAIPQPVQQKSILKRPDPQSLAIPAPKRETLPAASKDAPANVTKKVQEQLAQDDAQIEALEKSLGVKDKESLPKSFIDDGLDSLLDGLSHIGTLEATHLGKRRRREEHEWLQMKRRKAQPVDEGHDEPGSDTSLDFEDFESDEKQSSTDEESNEPDFDSEGASISDGEEDGPMPVIKRARENPYIAPFSSSSGETPAKYIPPSLRDQSEGTIEELSRIRRQLQGLLNRLSEANLLSIVGEMEEVYRLHPRQHVSDTLIDMLIGILSDPSTLQATFLILHAGLIAALYKVLGTAFGAQFVARVHQEIGTYIQGQQESNAIGKRATNLISVLAELYSFQVVGSGLIYDYVRVCLENLTEENTEILLKIIRIAGQQLRQDDPSALKEIIIQLHAAVSKMNANELSVRTRFMIETINNLKNNRMKTGMAASTIASEHTVRMKKTLGSMNQRAVTAMEPLRICLKDLRESEKVGKWWLIGARFKDESQTNFPLMRVQQDDRVTDEDGEVMHDVIGYLAQLAREQRMNTDVRRSIFIAIMSATDYNDAYLRLMKLRLKKSQELEIPKVLIHCTSAEKIYNPFYTLVSRRICSDRKLRMAFQFSLWDLFKQMGEKDNDDDGSDSDEAESKLPLRSLVNLARLFGTLIAESGLSLGILKNLNLAYLQPKTRTFVELLLTTVILHSQKSSGEGERNESAIADIFLKPKEMPQMAQSLRYFLKKVVGKGDVAGNEHDRDTVKWGSKVASDALSALSTHAIS